MNNYYRDKIVDLAVEAQASGDSQVTGVLMVLIDAMEQEYLNELYEHTKVLFFAQRNDRERS
jgi:hypothetical protein|tara:strand:+ start:501 stop:686 length:186 start_codon:yes stop_codon:yes gene_type:complete